MYAQIIMNNGKEYGMIFGDNDEFRNFIKSLYIDAGILINDFIYLFDDNLLINPSHIASIEVVVKNNTNSEIMEKVKEFKELLDKKN